MMNQRTPYAWVVLACFPASLSFAGTPTFSRTDFPAGSTPNSIAIGDLNADGRPDVVATNEQSGTVSVFLGDGNGGLVSATPFTVGSQTSLPVSVAIGDLNGDGKPDLAVANLGANAVSVLLGDGLGRFGSATSFGSGAAPTSVVIADMNRDGYPDLVVTSRDLNVVSVFLGDGHGSFGGATSFATGTHPICVAVADVNEDGNLDVAVANESTANVSILLGDGAGGLVGPNNFGAGAGCYSVAIGDVNGDGHLDLAVANNVGPSGTVSVLLGDGHGAFGIAVGFAAGSQPRAVSISDLNGDGHPDLALADQSGTASVLLGDGTGFFGSPTPLAVAASPYSIATADLNADGRPDLVVANYGSGTASVLINLGAGSPFFAYCSGAAPQSSPCPCGNSGLFGRGCQNSASTGGASLTATGTTIPDSVVLASSGELPSVLTIFLQGNVSVLPGAFGDGLLCTGGNLLRLYVKHASAGSASAPTSGDLSITARSASLGDPIASGSTRFYQAYYRDPVLSFCPAPMGDAWNVGSAVAISW